MQNKTIYNRTRKIALEKELCMEYKSLETIFSDSEIISLHTVKGIGEKYVNKNLMSLMKTKGLIINTSFETAVDFDAALPFLEKSIIRIAHDGPTPRPEYGKLPLAVWFNSNSHIAYATEEALQRTSNVTVENVVAFLENRNSPHRVL